MVSYKILKDEPDSVSNLFVGFEFLGVECLNVQATDFTFGLNANYELSNTLYFYSSYRRSFFSFNKFAVDPSDDNLLKTEKPPRFQFLELGGAFNFINLNTRSRTKIVIESTNSYDKFIKIPHQARIKYGVRGGIQLMTSDVICTNLFVPSNAYWESILKYSMFGFFVGIQRTKEINVSINAENYGKKERAQKLIFGMDLMLCKYNIYDKVGNDYSNILVKFDDNSTISLKEDLKNAAGYRFYWLVQNAKPHNALDFYLRAEVGFRPGYSSSKARIGVLPNSGLFERIYGSMALGFNLKKKI